MSSQQLVSVQFRSAPCSGMRLVGGGVQIEDRQPHGDRAAS